MSRVSRHRDLLTIEFADEESELLATLVQQYDELVRLDDRADPALSRLFPDGYRGDPDAAAEFRTYTREGLVDHKTANAGLIAAALVAGPRVELTLDETERWLPALTDLRLVLADRLGIVRDEDEIPEGLLGEVYDWLAELQSYLIEALDQEQP